MSDTPQREMTLDEFIATLPASHLARRQLNTLCNRIETLFDVIKHGDEKHRAWLRAAINDHFAGKPASRPEESTSRPTDYTSSTPVCPVCEYRACKCPPKKRRPVKTTSKETK